MGRTRAAPAGAVAFWTYFATTEQPAPSQGPPAAVGTSNCSHLSVNDLNISDPHSEDDRRTEVISNGLPLWNGAQLAVDTTPVSPLTQDGQPRRRAGRFAGASTTNVAVWSRRPQPSSTTWHEPEPDRHQPSPKKALRPLSPHVGPPH